MVNYKLAKVRAEIERRRDRHSKAKRIESALEDNAILSFIDSMQEEPKECIYSKDNFTDEDRKVLCEGCEEECEYKPITEEKKFEILDVCLIQYASRETGIKAHAEEYSFNIDSELFQQLTPEQQKLWRKEIEQAVLSGGYCGLELANDRRYDKQEPASEDLEEVIRKYEQRLEKENPATEAYDFASAIRFGVNWQKHQDKKWLADNHKRIFNNGYEEGFEAGRDDMEEQLMANAVDGFVIEDIEEGNGDFLLSAEYLSKDIGLKDRQKVKVIVIKED